MGDPHNINGLPYNVGTCRAGGVRDSHPSPLSLIQTHNNHESPAAKETKKEKRRQNAYQNALSTSEQFAARPSGFKCSPADSKIIQSYCDSTDPYCCNGNDANSHQQYVNKYGQQALAFIKKLLDASP